MRHALLFLSLLGVPGLGCETPPAPLPSLPAATPDAAVASSELVGDWRSYPAPAGEVWPTAPLTDARWAQATAELGCVGRAHHGDPEAHRAAMNQVLAQQQTTAEAVMEHGIAVNAELDRAHSLGRRVSEAVQRCR